jgi:hypothetical protein
MLLNSRSNSKILILVIFIRTVFGRFIQSLLDSNVYVIWQPKISDIRLPEVSKEPQIAASLVATTAIQPTISINQTHMHVLECGRDGQLRHFIILL